MSKHTLGPWHHTPMLHGVQGIYGPDGYMVADAGRTRRSVDEQVANARLIAAAPDLLAACEKAVNLLDTNDNDQREAYLAMRAAIAKATT